MADARKKKTPEHYLKEELYQLIRTDTTIFDFLQLGALDGLWYWDIERPEHEWMNAQFWESLGINSADKEHLASEWQELIFPEDLELALANFNAHCENPDHPYDQVVRYRHQDGSTVWIRCRGIAIRDDNGTPIRMLGVHNDITELKQTEEKLRLEEVLAEQRHAERQFQTVVESSPNGILIVNRAGEILLVNRQMEHYFGYDRKELLGKSYRQLIPKPVLESVSRDIEDFIQDDTQTKVFEAELNLRGLRKDGTEFPMTVELNSLEFEKQAAVLVTIDDITERRLAEQVLEERSTALAASNKELEQFAYIASHDLQEPLRAIAGCVQLLEQHYSDLLDEKGLEYIAYAVDGANRMQSMISDLLTYSQVGKEEIARQKVDCDKVMQTVCKNLHVMINETDAKVIWSDLPAINAIQSQLVLLFQNLVSNAIKFRKPDTPVQVEVSAEPGENHSWIFTFKDNGIGIEEQYFERIFVIFQRLHTRKTHSGSGLGLSLCQRIVELHGGKIWVESRPGAGSSFFVELPIVSA